MASASVDGALSADPDDAGPVDTSDIGPAEGQGAQPADDMLELDPHRGHCFLGEDEQGRFFVTDVRTLESKPCPVGQGWVLTFDENGFGAVTSTDADDVLVLEDWLGQSVYQNSSGAKVVMRKSRPSSLRPIAAWKQGYEEWSIICRGSAMIGEARLPCFKLAFPRQDSVWFVECGALYPMLQLKCYSGEASKWVYESMASWLKLTGDYGMRDQAMRSIQGLGVDPAMSDTMRFLARPAMSLKALICLLWRWSGSPPQLGGFRADVSKGLALSLARRLLEGICGADTGVPFDIPVSFDARWECNFPRPSKLSDGIVFIVDSAGRMDVSAWRDELDAGEVSPRHTKVKWWKVCADCGGDGGKVPLADMLQHKSFAQKAFFPFFGQLLYAIADRGERVLSVSTHGQGSGAILRAEAATLSPNDPRQVDRDLLRHVAVVQQATSGQLNISITSDKASVRGVSLLEAMVLIPQACGVPHVPPSPAIPMLLHPLDFFCRRLVYTPLSWCIPPVLGVYDPVGRREHLDLGGRKNAETSSTISKMTDLGVYGSWGGGSKKVGFWGIHQPGAGFCRSRSSRPPSGLVTGVFLGEKSPRQTWRLRAPSPRTRWWPRSARRRPSQRPRRRDTRAT